MQILFEKLLDILFPPSDDLLLVRSLTADEVRTCFFERTVDQSTVLADFRDARIRALIHEAKFHANSRASYLLGTLFVMYMNLHSIQLDTTLIVPVPLSTPRRRERGHNQVVTIIKAAQRQMPTFTCTEQLLQRSRHTRPQTELTKNERIENMHGAFTVRRRHLPTPLPEHVILVDDVLTTGATLGAAKAALSLHLPKTTHITTLALAH